MDIQPLDILKWIGLVLAAGFIGYFGRYLAMLIIERMHRRQPQQTSATVPAEAAPARQDKPEQSQFKLEKKRAKAEAKRAKKAGKK